MIHGDGAWSAVSHVDGGTVIHGDGAWSAVSLVDGGTVIHGDGAWSAVAYLWSYQIRDTEGQRASILIIHFMFDV